MALNLNSEAARPFPCPACREYLSVGVASCRFWGAEISEAAAQVAVRTEAVKNRLYRRKHYRKHLPLGAGLFSLGVLIMVVLYFFFQEVFDTEVVWIPRALVFGGAGEFLYGIYGLVSEATSARKEVL